MRRARNLIPPFRIFSHVILYRGNDTLTDLLFENPESSPQTLAHSDGAFAQVFFFLHHGAFHQGSESSTIERTHPPRLPVAPKRVLSGRSGCVLIEIRPTSNSIHDENRARDEQG